jgi:hypothetical protein
MLDATAVERVDEAMCLDGAPTGIIICEYGEALEAKLGHTASAEHLVALLPLGLLRSQVLLAYPHLANRALDSSGAPHPTPKARVGSLRFLLYSRHLRSVLCT